MRVRNKCWSWHAAKRRSDKSHTLPPAPPAASQQPKPTPTAVNGPKADKRWLCPDVPKPADEPPKSSISAFTPTPTSPEPLPTAPVILLQSALPSTRQSNKQRAREQRRSMPTNRSLVVAATYANTTKRKDIIQGVSVCEQRCQPTNASTDLAQGPRGHSCGAKPKRCGARYGCNRCKWSFSCLQLGFRGSKNGQWSRRVHCPKVESCVFCCARCVT